MRLRLPLVLLLTGIAAGLGGIAVTSLLHAVQHLAFGTVGGRAETGALRAGARRRLAALAAAATVGALGWWALRRGHGVVGIGKAMDGSAMPVARAWLNAALQVVVVGGGASLGREVAPREIAAAAGAFLAERLGLEQRQRRLVIACGAGAGLAAVYNVPLSGALFALETMLRTVAPVAVGAAVAVSAIATVVADAALGNQATYALPTVHPDIDLVLCALVLAPLAGLVGLGFRTLTSKAQTGTPTGWHLLPACLLAFAALGGVAAAYPQVLGNGKTPTQLVLAGALGLPTIAVLLLLKPLATAACLRAGAVGGRLTPAVATGALLGGLVGGAGHSVAPGTPVAAVAVVGAAAVLSVTMRAPVTAAVLLLEFTGGGAALVVPVVIGVAGAQVTAALTGRAGTLGR